MSCLCCSVCFSFLCRWTMWRKTVVFRMPQPYWCPRREVVCSTLQWTVSSPIPRPRWTAALSTGTPTATMSGFIAQHLSSTMWLDMRNLLCLEKKRKKKKKTYRPTHRMSCASWPSNQSGIIFPLFFAHVYWFLFWWPFYNTFSDGAWQIHNAYPLWSQC